MRSNNKYLADDKVMSMMSILEDIRIYPYASETKKRILTAMEDYAINYLLYELPEGLTYKEYCNKLDDFIVNLIKKEIK